MRKTVVLPDGEDIIRRMRTVCDEELLATTFYRQMAENGQATVSPLNLVTLLLAALLEYEHRLIPDIYMALFLDMGHFIDALVDDQDFAAHAKETLDSLKTKVEKK